MRRESARRGPHPRLALPFLLVLIAGLGLGGDRFPVAAADFAEWDARPAQQAPSQDLDHRLHLPWTGRNHRAEAVWRHYRNPRIEGLVHDAASESLWAATANGLLRWDLQAGLERSETFTVADGMISDELRSLALDGAGAIWVGGVGGVSRRNLAGEWTSWTVEDGLPPAFGTGEADVTALSPGTEGRMLAGTKSGLVELGPDGRWAALEGYPLGDAWVDDLAYSAASGDLAVATSVGAAIRNADGRWERIGDRWVDAAAIDAPGNVWFGGRGVSVRWRQDGSWGYYDPAFTIRDIAVSPDGTIHCATDEGLSSRAPDGSWSDHVPEGGDWQERFASLATSADGRLWAGRWDGHLDHRDRAGRWSARRIGGLPDQAESLALGPAGEVWIGGMGGAARLGPDGSWRWFGRQAGVLGSSVSSILVDRTGLTWIGTGGNDGLEPRAGLYTVDQQGRVQNRTPADLDDRGIGPALLGQDGSVWHAIHYAGLLVHRPDGSSMRIPLPAPFQAASITSAAVGETGTLWWSLYGGDTVLGLDPSGVWKVLQEGTGLHAGKVSDMDAWSWGPVWTVGAQGIQRGLSGGPSEGPSEFWPAAELGFPLSRQGTLLGAVIGVGPNWEVAVAHSKGLGLMDAQEEWQHLGKAEVPFLANLRDVRIAENGGIWFVSSSHGLSLLLR